MEQQSGPTYYQETLDLRDLVKTLLRWAWVIVLAGFLAATAAYLTSKFLLEPTYESTTLVAILEPSLVMELDPRITSSSQMPEMPDMRALADLAKAKDLLSEFTPSDSQATFEATILGSNQLQLTVTDPDPDQAAALSNAWAACMVSRLNELYGSTDTRYAIIEEEMELARQNWDAAQLALEKYLANSQVDVLTSQRDILYSKSNQTKNKLNTYLDRVDNNQLLIKDVESFDARLESLSQSSGLPTGDALSMMALQQRATGALQSTQIQFPGIGGLGEGYTVRQARLSIKELLLALEIQNTELEAELPAIETKIEDLALQIQALSVAITTEEHQITQLTQQRSLAKDAYSALAGFLEETKISLSADGQSAKIAAKALAPEDPSSPRTLMNTALAGVVGLMLAVGMVFVAEWWREGEEENDPV